MKYSKLQKPCNSQDKFIINLKIQYGKYLEYDLKQNDRGKLFFLLNSANIALLLSVILVLTQKWENET